METTTNPPHLFKLGDNVQTTPEYEAVFLGKRIQGEVVNYSTKYEVVTILSNGDKKMLHKNCLIKA